MAEKKQITVNVGDDAIEFNVSLPDYNNYINNAGGGKLSVTINALLRGTVSPEHKTTLEQYIQNGLALQIVAALLEGFVPEVEVTLKK